MPVWEVRLTKTFKIEAENKKEAKKEVIHEENSLDPRKVDILAFRIYE